MQLTSILLPIVGLASIIGATPVPSADVGIAPRAAEGTFEITEFSDGGIRYSQKAEISFTVRDHSTGAAARCYYTAAEQPPVTAAPFFTRCSPSGISFAIQTSVTRGPKGQSSVDWYLTVAHKYKKNSISDVGTIWLGSIIGTKQVRGREFNYLKAPDHFKISYNRFTQTPLPFN